jgi:HEPN domain-containing protein
MDDKQTTLRRWLLRAQHDLETAEAMIDHRNPPTDIVCYHCQQCAEKCLKAFLVERDQDFPKTHDLERLLALCIEYDAACATIEEEVVRLTGYAVTTRYIDDWREIGEDEAREAIMNAGRVSSFLRSKLGA